MKEAQELIIGIICATIGAILSYFLPQVDTYLKTRRRSDLQGEWLSVSHGGEEDRVEDRIELSMRGGKLYLMNKEKPLNYSYDAYCEVKNKHLLIGSWKSLLPGSSVMGEMMLLISSHGDYMYGIYSGSDREGKPMLLGWALGRNKEALLQGEKSLVENLRTPKTRLS